MRVLRFRLRLMSAVGLGLALGAAAAPLRADTYRLKLYYDGPPAVAREIERAFERYRGDVLAVVPLSREDSPDSLAASADLVWGGGEALHAWLRAAGRLLSYRSSELAALVMRRGREESPISGVDVLVIAYDPGRVQTPPEKWRDLLNGRWSDRLAIRDPAAAWSSLGAPMASALGWRFLESLAAERPILAENDSAALAAVIEGRALAAVVPRSAAAEFAPRLNVARPEDSTVAVPLPIGILAQDRRPAMMTGLAEQLVDFVLSREGQTIAGRYGVYPSRKDVNAPGDALGSAAMPPQETSGPEELVQRLRKLFGGR